MLVVVQQCSSMFIIYKHAFTVKYHLVYSLAVINIGISFSSSRALDDLRNCPITLYGALTDVIPYHAILLHCIALHCTYFVLFRSVPFHCILFWAGRRGGAGQCGCLGE